MASNLGSLVVSLSLDAAEFVQGLSKSQYEAQRATQQIARQFGDLKSELSKIGSTLGLAFGTKEIVDWAEAVVSSAEKLRNLSIETGSSVEALSKLKNIAQVSGTDFDTMRTVMDKLSAAMGGAEVRGSRVAEVLKLLGITAKDPAEAMTQLAQKLGQYADGTGKAALLQDAFRISGVQLASTMKSIAENADVAATVTTRQADDAAKLAESFRLLQVQSTGLKNAFLIDVVPAILAVTTVMNDAIASGNGLTEALNRASMVNPFASTADNLARLRSQLEGLDALIAKRQSAGPGLLDDFKNGLGSLDVLGVGPAKALQAAIAQRASVLAAIQALQGRETGFGLGDRSGVAVVKPQPPGLPPIGQVSATAKAELDKAFKEQQDAIRASQDLLKNNEQITQALYQSDLISLKDYYAVKRAAQDGELQAELAAYDKEEAAARKAIASAANPQARIDAEKRLGEAVAARARAVQDAATKDVLSTLEQDKATRDYAKSVSELDVKILQLRGDTAGAAMAQLALAQEAQRRIATTAGNAATLAKLDLEAKLTRQQQDLNKATSDYANITTLLGLAQSHINVDLTAGNLTEIESLNKRSELNRAMLPILQQEADAYAAIAATSKDPAVLLTAIRLREEVYAVSQQVDLLADKFRGTLTDAGTSALDKLVAGGTKFSDVLRQGAKDLEAAITHIVDQNLMETAFKKGGLLGDLPFGLSSILGGGKADTGAAALTGAGTTLNLAGLHLDSAAGAISAAAAMLGVSSGSNLASGFASTAGGFLGSGLSSGNPFTDLFSLGLIPGAASGTDSAFGGPTIVGERGPELVNLPRGAQVIPNSTLTAKRTQRAINIVQHINVMPGASTASARQAANQLRDATSAAIRGR